MNHQPRWSHDGNFVFFYQITPEQGLRRVPALGGPTTQVFPWEWQTHNGVRFDPSGQRLVYTRLNPLGRSSDLPEATVVHEIADARERELQGPYLSIPGFSTDGRWIVGIRRDRSIAICGTETGACRTVLQLDAFSPVQWSGDGSPLYFLRGAGSGLGEALWSVRVDGTDEHKHRDLGVFRTIDRFFDVSVHGDVVWAPTSEGRRELWTAVIR